MCESEILSDMYVFFDDTGMILFLNHNDKRRCTASALAIVFSGDLQWLLEPKGRQ